MTQELSVESIETWEEIDQEIKRDKIPALPEHNTVSDAATMIVRMRIAQVKLGTSCRSFEYVFWNWKCDMSSCSNG